MMVVGALRLAPDDANVLERWNGKAWLFYSWVDLSKAAAL